MAKFNSYGTRRKAPFKSEMSPIGIGFATHFRQDTTKSKVALNAGKLAMETEPDAVFKRYMMQKPSTTQIKQQLKNYLALQAGTKFESLSKRQVKQWVEDYLAHRPYSGVSTTQ